MATEAGKKVTNLSIKESKNDEQTVVATWSIDSKLEHIDHYAYTWSYYRDGGWYTNDGTTKDKIVNYGYPNGTKKIKIKVKPVSTKHTVDKKEKSYWTGSYVTSDTFTILAPEPEKPLKGEPPAIEILDESKKIRTTITVQHDSTATHYELEIQTSGGDLYDKHTFKSYKSEDTLSYTCKSEAPTGGIKYRARVRGMIAEEISNSSKIDQYEVFQTGYWSEWSEYVQTDPDSPVFKSLTAKTSTLIRAIWDSSEGAKGYRLEYVADNEHNFTRIPDSVGSWETDTTARVADVTVESGHTYYFRVAAKGKNGELSKWSEIESVTIGHLPNAPTTWTLKSTYPVDSTIRLYWTHNSVDGSVCTESLITLKTYLYSSPDSDPIEHIERYVMPNKNKDNEDKKNDTMWLDFNIGATNSPHFPDGSIITWYVRTSGIQMYDGPSDNTVSALQLDGNGDSLNKNVSVDLRNFSPKSAERKITMAFNPKITIASDASRLAYMKQYAAYQNLTSITSGRGSGIMETFPILFAAYAEPKSVKILQWYVEVSSNETYEYIDYDGEIKHVHAGEIVYSKIVDPTTFDGHDTWLGLILNPKDIKLEDDKSYHVTYKVIATSGLYDTVEFNMVTKFKQYDVDVALDTKFNPTDFSMTLYPSVSSSTPCVLDVYRMNYDGSFTQIGASSHSSKPSNLVDMYPSLKIATYRLVATVDATGQQFYVDMQEDVEDLAGMTGIIIQWDSRWRSFYDNEDDNPVVPLTSGSKIILYFNIDTTEKVEKDVTLVSYIGRENPVAYYGTQKKESGSWKADIPADDEELLFQLRRLSRYKGDCYVREPSGIGYWATVNVDMSTTHQDVIIPVSIEVTRVEGDD